MGHVFLFAVSSCFLGVNVMKHIAIMQPYLFPYLGYYQLVRHVEQFVFLDDVNYIKKGYINRNSILLADAAYRFTLPVKNVSQNRYIRDHWYLSAGHVLKVLEYAYKKAPYFADVYPLVCTVLEATERRVSILAARSVESVFEYLEISKSFCFSSTIAIDEGAKGQEKILALCSSLGATKYTNAIGGRELYQNAAFEQRQIVLEFIKMLRVTYQQAVDTFVPNLSVLDVLMWCSKEQVRELLDQYTILRGSDALERAVNCLDECAD